MFAKWFAAKKDSSKIKNELAETIVSSWTVQQVQDWLEVNDLKDLKPNFAKQSMNGEALLDMSNEDLATLGVCKIGHKKKLLKLVQELQDQNLKQSSSTGSIPIKKKKSTSSNNSILSSSPSNKMLSSSPSNMSPTVRNRIMTADCDTSSDEMSGDDLEANIAQVDHYSAASSFEVFEDFADGVVVIGAKEKQIMYVNKSVEKMFLFKRNEIIGANVKVLMAEPHKSKHDTYVDSYLKTGKKKIIGHGRMVEARMKDGTLFPLWLSIAESENDAGEKVFIGTMKDLRSVQLQSKKKVNQMMVLLDNLVDSVVVMSQDCQVMFFNKSAEKLFQYKSDEVVGQNVNVLMQQQIAMVHDQYVNRYMQTKKANVIGKGREVIAKRKDGTLIRILLSVTETKWDEDTSRISFMGTMQLIADIKDAVDTHDFTPKSDKNLEQSEQEQNELFEEVLDVPEAKILLYKFLKANKNSEMLQFLDDVDLFRAAKSHKYRHFNATNIMSYYIKNESKAELNLPNTHRQDLLNKFATAEINERQCPTDLFNNACTSIKVDLVQGPFHSFLQTQEFKTYLQQNAPKFSNAIKK